MISWKKQMNELARMLDIAVEKFKVETHKDCMEQSDYDTYVLPAIRSMFDWNEKPYDRLWELLQFREVKDYCGYHTNSVIADDLVDFVRSDIADDRVDNLFGYFIKYLQVCDTNPKELLDYMDSFKDRCLRNGSHLDEPHMVYHYWYCQQLEEIRVQMNMDDPFMKPYKEQLGFTKGGFSTKNKRFLKVYREDNNNNGGKVNIVELCKLLHEIYEIQKSQ